ncbi:hypothetical protein I5E62_30720, partial [Pseudomonas aeruginosa]|nr:hypothetical protein [Pseudomonas aeruginosa]
GLLALAGVLGVGEGHLLHRKALRVKSADFAKSGSLFQSFPKDKSAFIILLAHAQGKRRLAELRRVLPLSLDVLISAKDRAVSRGWLTRSGALTLAGHKAIRLLRRQGRKNFVAPDPFASYYPTQLRAPL